MIQDKASLEVCGTYVSNVPLDIQENPMFLDFQVMTMDRANVVPRREWLHGLSATLKRIYEHNSFMFDYNGNHVFLLEKKKKPLSPFICIAEIVSLLSEIDQVFVCYYLCYLLSNESFQNFNDKMM